MMLRPNRPKSYAENQLEALLSIDRELTQAERRDLSYFRKLLRNQKRKRELYATDPEYRRREIERNTRYWREHRA